VPESALKAAFNLRPPLDKIGQFMFCYFFCISEPAPERHPVPVSSLATCSLLIKATAFCSRYQATVIRQMNASSQTILSSNAAMGFHLSDMRSTLHEAFPYP
jgi:hypothetical protein